MKIIHWAPEESLQFMCSVKPFWPGMKGSLRNSSFWAGCLCVLPSTAQRLLSGSCPILVWGQSWFLSSALQGGTFRGWHQTVEDSGFLWRGVFRNFSFSPPIPNPFSSTDLAKDHCHSRRKTEARRTWWSEIPAGVVYFPHQFDFSQAVAVQKPSTRMLSAFQSCFGVKGGSSLPVLTHSLHR